MKVCTDACLFGAVAANCKLPTANLLEIGAGTGLLSLMYAQKEPFAGIDAVEIDKNAAIQAKENFNDSPWKDRLHIINEDILQYKADKKYDCIISNPPFFENDLRSDDESKNKAKHDSSLSLQQLLKVVNIHLSQDGWFAVLLPYHRVGYFEELGTASGLYLTQRILVRQSPKHDLFRGILFFSGEKTELKTSEMSIRETDGNYSTAFVELLKDYYLNL